MPSSSKSMRRPSPLVFSGDTWIDPYGVTTTGSVKVRSMTAGAAKTDAICPRTLLDLK